MISVGGETQRQDAQGLFVFSRNVVGLRMDVKASNFKGLFWRKRTEKWREVTIAKEENRSGNFLRVVVKAGGSLGVICVPELMENHGWTFVAEKMQRFAVERNPESKKPGKSYKEEVEIPSWPGEDLITRSTTKQSGVDFEVVVDSCKGSSDFLSRCLVGRVGDLDCPIPSRATLQNWVDRRWQTAGGVRDVDMNGNFFLFEFPSKEEALRILRKENWVVNGEPLLLDRWSAIGCCRRGGREPRVAWVRALGLPLHLWGTAVFRKIGQLCGGFVRVDENTELRRDLRWARILVHFRGEMPASVKIGVGEHVFRVPIWAETTAYCYQREAFFNGVGK